MFFGHTRHAYMSSHANHMLRAPSAWELLTHQGAGNTQASNRWDACGVLSRYWLAERCAPKPLADQDSATEQRQLQSSSLSRSSWQSSVQPCPPHSGGFTQPHTAAASEGLSQLRHSCWSAGRCCGNDCKREGCQLDLNLSRHVFEFA